MTEMREKPEEKEKQSENDVPRLGKLEVSRDSISAIPNPNGSGMMNMTKLFLGLARPTLSGGTILRHDFTLEEIKKLF